jgi:hypothetical protein
LSAKLEAFKPAIRVVGNFFDHVPISPVNHFLPYTIFEKRLNAGPAGGLGMSLACAYRTFTDDDPDAIYIDPDCDPDAKGGLGLLTQDFRFSRFNASVAQPPSPPYKMP